MVVTIDSKFYSKLQLGISKYQEKTPADPLNVQKKWPHETSFTNEAYIVTLGLPLNGSKFGI